MAEVQVEHNKKHLATANAMIVKYGVHAALEQAKWYLSQADGPGLFRDEWEGVVAILTEKKEKVDNFNNEGGE